MIPPKHIAQKWAQKKADSGVYMSSQHLCLGPDVMALFGADTQNVFLAYYPERQQLLLSPVGNAFFTKLHKATQHILKQKNMRGATSVAVHELLIDEVGPIPDGPLEYEFVPRSQLLKISLSSDGDA